MNMTTVLSDQLKAMQQEIADLKEQVALYAGIDDEKSCIAHRLDRANETIAQQAEAIRVKDGALDWCIGEFNLRLYDIDLSQETIRVRSARHIQPSPEILQDRDEVVAEACCKVVDNVIDTFGIHSLVGVVKAKIRSGEWRALK